MRHTEAIWGATLYVQKENPVFSSLVVPCVWGLIRKLDALSAKYNGSHIKALKNATSQWPAAFDEHSTINTAAMLYPKIKLSWTRREGRHATTVDWSGLVNTFICWGYQLLTGTDSQTLLSLYQVL